MNNRDYKEERSGMQCAAFLFVAFLLAVTTIIFWMVAHYD